MDLGIAGKTALICGSSKGLGRACAEALAVEGVNVVLLARTQSTLDQTAHEIRERHRVEVSAVPCDVTTVGGRRDAIAACGRPDILVTNAGGPPTGDSRTFTFEQWTKAVNDNMLAPLEMIRATIDGMMERGFGRVIYITSWAVKAPGDPLLLSAAARLGLTGYAAGVARSVAPRNVTVNNLLPGVYDTERMITMAATQAKRLGLTVEEVERQQAQSIPARRYGHPSEFGAVCAFLCSMHAGYITGQNLMLDGGRFPGLF